MSPNTILNFEVLHYLNHSPILSVLEQTGQLDCAISSVGLKAAAVQLRLKGHFPLPRVMLQPP